MRGGDTMIKGLLGVVVAGTVFTTVMRAQTSMPLPTGKETQSKPATPLGPITAIIEAFRSHTVVALGNVEFRGNEQSHAFQLSLIRTPGFAATVNDILVEFGDARYQEVIDRFLRGEEVPDESLRSVWQNTTQVEYEWDLPIYEEFFRAVRAVNAALPRSRQLRALLGDPPIDWDKVQ